MAQCSICLNQCKNPNCCIPCGHVFCRVCINRWKRHQSHGTYDESQGGNCPVCRTQIISTQPIMFDTTAASNGKTHYYTWQCIFTDFSRLVFFLPFISTIFPMENKLFFSNFFFLYIFVLYHIGAFIFKSL